MISCEKGMHMDFDNVFVEGLIDSLADYQELVLEILEGMLQTPPGSADLTGAIAKLNEAYEKLSEIDESVGDAFKENAEDAAVLAELLYNVQPPPLDSSEDLTSISQNTL